MAILVDDAVWPWRGERWAHLVSDVSVAELHEFSRRLRVRRLSFSGDHYDVTAAARIRALELGAIATTGRDIVRRLRAAGLRRRHVGSWEQVAAVPVAALNATLAPLVSSETVGLVEEAIGTLLGAGPTSDARVVTRGDEVVSAVVTARESQARLADGFELRITPTPEGWFSEVATHPSEVRR